MLRQTAPVLQTSTSHSDCVRSVVQQLAVSAGSNRNRNSKRPPKPTASCHGLRYAHEIRACYIIAIAWLFDVALLATAAETTIIGAVFSYSMELHRYPCFSGCSALQPAVNLRPSARSARGWANTIEAIPAAINNTCCAVARNSVRL